jgi:hypothetical protein
MSPDLGSFRNSEAARPTLAKVATARSGVRQGELFAAEPWPEGFAYREEVISPEEEQALAERFALLPLTPFACRGFLARVVAFGWRYDYARRACAQTVRSPAC